MLTQDEVFAIIVGRALRRARLKIELDQDFLAERLNLSQPGVSKIERLGRCGLPMFHKYCIAVETTPKEVIATTVALYDVLMKDSEDGKLARTTKEVGLWSDDVFAEWVKEDEVEEMEVNDT
jgi:transcriptional regulator with XRE-family HTH domain